MPASFARFPRAAALSRQFLIGSVIVVAAACGQTDRFTPEQHIERAKVALAAKKPGEASIELKSALQTDPKNVEARLLFADAYIALGQGPQAETEIDRAEQLGAKPESTRVRRGRAYLLQENFERVIRDVPATTSGDVADVADRMEIRGEAQLGLGRPAEAFASFNTALGIRPTSVPALLGKARVAAQRGDLDGAGSLIDSAVKVDPKNTKALIFRGDLQLARNDLPGAIKAYTEAVDSDKDNVNAHLALASAYIQSKQYDEARQHIKMIKAAYPLLPSVNYLEAVMLFTEKKNQEALEANQKVMSALPDYPASLVLAGAIQFVMGSLVPAEVNTRKFIQTSPNNLFGRKLLAAILLKEQQAPKALEVLEPLLTNPQLKDVDVYRLAGAAYLQTNQVPKAVGYLQQAAAINPTDTSLRTAIGLSNLVGGNVDQAISAFQSVVNVDGGNSNADAFLILSFIAKQDFKGAIKAAQALTSSHPDNPDMFNLLGGAFQAAKDVPGARGAYEKAMQLSPTSSSTVINLARLDMGEKKPDDARKRLVAFSEKNPKNIDVLYALSNIEFMQGHTAEGTHWLDVAAKVDPGALSPRILQIRQFLQQRDFARAVALARETEPRFPQDMELLALLAEAQAASGDRSGASSTYGKLASLSPKSSLIQMQIAHMEIADNHLTSGAAALQKALALNPLLVPAQIELSEVYVQMQRYDDALTVAANAQKLNPKSGVGSMIAGNVYMAQKKYDRAIKAYDDAAQIEKSGVLIAKQHAALVQAGKKADAEALISKWIAEQKGDVPSRLYLAAFSAREQNVARAESLYEEVVKIDPNNVVALNELALLLDAKGDRRAIDFAQRAFATKSGGAPVADTYAWLAVKGGKIAEGRGILEQLVRDNPEYSEARYHLAVAQYKSGDKAAAKENLQKAIQSRVSFVELRDAQKLLATF